MRAFIVRVRAPVRESRDRLIENRTGEVPLKNQMCVWLAQWRIDRHDSWKNDWSLEQSEGVFTVAVFFTKKEALIFIKGCARGTERVIPITMTQGKP